MSSRNFTNVEGLTWLEFIRATSHASRKFSSMYEESKAVSVLYDAWKRGEDPSEYR